MKKQNQLQMIWREELQDRPAIVSLPKGYEIRTLRPGDEAGHIAVMREAGFDDWNEEKLNSWRDFALPDGIFVVEYISAKKIVATAMATHQPGKLQMSVGEIGWVAASPDHAGQGLGMAVCAAALSMFAQAGYRRIYLKTDDRRLPAIKTYIKLGFCPYLYADGMQERWLSVFEKLQMLPTPGNWEKA